jgi:putative CocE/NonD family hydrolase
MKIAALAWALLLSLLPWSWAGAQQMDFEAPAHLDDPSTPAVMKDLAERVLPVYQEDNPELYLSTLSALQLVAGSYDAATGTRQTLRERRLAAEPDRLDGRATLTDIYTDAMALAQRDKLPFAQAFEQSYRDTLAKIRDQSAYYVTNWKPPAVAPLHEAAQRAFDQRHGQASISMADAVELIRTYLAYEIVRSYTPLLAGLDAEDEQRRYTPEERLVIRGKGGVVIKALMVRPKGASQPLPALLEFTIYANSPNFARECAAHGYVGVVAYTRETPGTPYRVVPFEHDGEDARTVINWIAQQPWSNGQVGMYGVSYSGFTQWAAAKHLPAALKAIATASPNAPGIDFPMRNNIFRNAAYRWAYNVTNPRGWDDTYNDARWRELEQSWYVSGKSYFEFDRTDGKPNRFFHKWLHHPSYDAYWQSLVPYRAEFARINIPVFSTAGYYGGDLPGALYYFDQHNRFNPKADQTLLIGPYDDGAMQRTPLAVLRGLQVDPVALVDLRELRYEWFDFVLKGAPKPLILSDRVNFELTGANEWRHVPSIAAMANGKQRYFLAATAATDQHHQLASAKPAKAAFTRQTVDFADRRDSSWTSPYNVIGNELPLHNGLAFVSEPLERATDAAGLISGHLDFTANRQDLDLTVAVYEQLASGDYLALFDPAYSFRASYSADRSHRHLLKDGERQQLSFETERLVSRRLQAGSRVVVVLGVSKTPELQINYGGGDDVSAETLEDNGAPPLEIHWYNSSYIELPVQQP